MGRVGGKKMADKGVVRFSYGNHWFFVREKIHTLDRRETEKAADEPAERVKDYSREEYYLDKRAVSYPLSKRWDGKYKEEINQCPDKELQR